ncbi:hypothetical protein F2P56_024033 [Juglans regia]|uniref:rhamnogalacturonan endolyase n=1 Tax=Juglans regia TaxID=51240 RepID=A0A833X2G5_JUGRE|nr:hypothetical protein F2P56_024033 [Juglans regia]
MWFACWVLRNVSMILLVYLILLLVCAEKTPLRGVLLNVNAAQESNVDDDHDVELHTYDDLQVVVDNGLMQVNLSRPAGDVVGITYGGIDNLLENHNRWENRGYWDVVWKQPGGPGGNGWRLAATNFTIITETEDQVELSFTKTWDASNNSLHGKTNIPLNVDRRYIFRRGISGYYSYAIFERPKGWPALFLGQIRAVYKLEQDNFHYMAISDKKRRIMPTPLDRKRGQPLAYPEAVLLSNTTSNPELRGEVDDKYQYSMEDKDIRVHGWMSVAPPVGFWIITPSNEFRTAGPIKQDLTGHVGPTLLSMFMSTHYTGRDLHMRFEDGEPWQKVFGPIFVYLNSGSTKTRKRLWGEAKQQMLSEVNSWPYNFTKSEDFPSADQRGTVVGQLQVDDQYITDEKLMRAKSAYVGLAAPGGVGSWQTESKGYQFWTQADDEGRFVIKNVRAGDYNLYAWVPGVIGDYKNDMQITIKPGSKVELGVVVYRPPRNGPTLWEIGIPDRTAAEFFIPDPKPTLTNRLFNHTEKYRQYGLWDRYADLYQDDQDLIYTVNISNYSKDWFYAHVTRKLNNQTYEGTTWQIKFELENATNDGNYTLQLALASAHFAEIQVRFNDPSLQRAHFSTGLIGRDNAIARHGIHGLYRLYNIEVPSNLLQEGTNRIYLTQSRRRSPFIGVMYDYLRLEGPPHDHACLNA